MLVHETSGLFVRQVEKKFTCLIGQVGREGEKNKIKYVRPDDTHGQQ